MNRRLLLISHQFPPQTYPLALGLKAVLEHLRKTWKIDAVTAAEDTADKPNLRVHETSSWAPERFFQTANRLRLGKLMNLLLWPDTSIFWAPPAFLKAQQLAQKHQYDAIIVFMMPYSSGLTGMLLKRMTGLPLVFNMDDSPTCSDMRPSFPTQFHYAAIRWLENTFVQTSDATVYVSRHNMERVRSRQPETHRDKLHLVRFGSNGRTAANGASSDAPDALRVVYTGGMSGWYPLLKDGAPRPLSERLYQRWKALGRHQLTELDPRTHNPVTVGKAVRRVVHQHPAWAGRLHVTAHGNCLPQQVVDQVLAERGLSETVSVRPPVSHEEALDHMRTADVLFMSLPNRVDGSPGGRISAKTYEYLMTDRPILAALPPGENRDYLRDKPGVHLVDPDDKEAMAQVLEELAARKFAGKSLAVDRSRLRPELTNARRAEALAEVVEKVINQAARNHQTRANSLPLQIAF